MDANIPSARAELEDMRSIEHICVLIFQPPDIPVFNRCGERSPMRFFDIGAQEFSGKKELRGMPGPTRRG